MRVDVLIIGGGVIGCAAARELSRKRISVALLEAADDVATKASAANSGIVHAGYDAPPGSLMARLNVAGNAMYANWCDELQVPLSRVGSLVVAVNGEEDKVLDTLYQQGQQNKVPELSIVSGGEAHALEPKLSLDVTKALHAKTCAITCPYQLTIACFENAMSNGVSFYHNTPVTAIEKQADGFIVKSPNRQFEARFIINAAGLFADDIARMIGDDSFAILPRKGEYLLLDHSADNLSKVIFQTPTNMGKGVLVAPTVDGNAYAGPTATDQDSREDNDTTFKGMESIRQMAIQSVPSINFREVITAFAGLRAHSDSTDFIIRPSYTAPHMIHAAGICSPGLSSAPAIAGLLVELLQNAGLFMPEKENFQPIRPAIRRFAEMTFNERKAAIEENPLYSRIICRCEAITEAEIVEAVKRGARSLDAVKRRTRAGMGRCQGGFCSPRVMEIISREATIPMLSLTKFGGKSTLLTGKLKEARQ